MSEQSIGVVERFKAAHVEWREASVHHDETFDLWTEAQARLTASEEEMGAARIQLVSDTLDGKVLDALTQEDNDV